MISDSPYPSDLRMAGLIVACCQMASAQLPTVRDPGQGLVSLSSGGTGAAEFPEMFRSL